MYSHFENVETAADFYMTMGKLIQQLITDEFIPVQKLLQVTHSFCLVEIFSSFHFFLIY